MILNKPFNRPSHIHYKDIKTNMRHIHTAIVSMHLATKGNNKNTAKTSTTNISSEEIRPRLTRRTIQNKQISLPPNHTYTKSAPNYIHHHYTPSVTRTHTTHTITSTTPTYTPHSHPWICGHTPLEWWSCWPDGGINWLVDQKRDDRTPPQTRVKGMGRQQQLKGAMICWKTLIYGYVYTL